MVPKKKIIPVVDLLDGRKETPIMEPGQWLLMTHDMQKIYVPIPSPMSGGVVTFGRNQKDLITGVGKVCISPYPTTNNVLLVKYCSTIC